MGLLRSLLLTGAIVGGGCAASARPAAPAATGESTITDEDLAKEVSEVPDLSFVESLSRAWHQLEPRIEAGIASASPRRDRRSRDSQRSRLWALERERQMLEERARAARFRADKARDGQADETARQSLVEVSGALEKVEHHISGAKPALMQTLAEIGSTESP
jgi:hypothetical protein